MVWKDKAIDQKEAVNGKLFSTKNIIFLDEFNACKAFVATYVVASIISNDGDLDSKN